VGPRNAPPLEALQHTKTLFWEILHHRIERLHTESCSDVQSLQARLYNTSTPTKSLLPRPFTMYIPYARGKWNLYYYSTTIIQLVPGFKGAFLQVLKQVQNGQ
jgi:hypothetical protein